MCTKAHPSVERVLLLYTPGSDEHGPRFLTGRPGAAPGDVASKNGWGHMRVREGGPFPKAVSVCLLCLSQNGSLDPLQYK